MFPTWSCHPAASLAIRHLSVPALEQLTGAMGICQLPFWANSAKQEGKECSFFSLAATEQAPDILPLFWLIWPGWDKELL